MNRYIAHYTLVRLLPQPDAGEFANIGVVVGCPALGYFDYRLVTRYRRVTHFFEEFAGELFTQVRRDLNEELRHLHSYVQTQLQPQPHGERPPNNLIQQLMHNLVQPRETLLRYAPLRVATTPDPVQLLEELFGRYVQRDNKEPKLRKEDAMVLQLRQVLQQDSRLPWLYRAEDVGHEDYQVHFPLVHRHEGQTLAAIKALDLTQSEPQHIYEHGGHWAERLRRLNRLGALPPGVLIATEVVGEDDARRHRAGQHIVAELQELPVQLCASSDTAPILAFARHHAHPAA